MSRRGHALLTLLAVVALLAWLPGIGWQPALAASTADLSVTVARSVKNLKYGKTTSIAFTISNGGPDTATGVAVSVGTSDSLANFGGTCPDGSVSSFCTIGALAPGESVTLSFEVGAANLCCPERVGVVVASVLHDAETIDPNSANDSVRVEIRLKGQPEF